MQVEQWIADLPSLGSGPDAGGAAPPDAAAAIEAWEKDWQALMDSKDFQRDMARVLLEGLTLERRFGAAWPALEERKTRLRRETSQILVTSILRLELLERSAPELQAKQVVEWQRTSRSGRTEQLEQLFALEREHVDRFARIRPEGGIGDAIRDQRHRFKQAVDHLVQAAMERGYDNRLQEALAVRWLARPAAGSSPGTTGPLYVTR
ncbi:MAG: hypothetical protein AAF957_23910 [Planctomycetota bacterium]